MSYVSVVLADNPSFLWLLNETAGTAAADASPHGYAGTYQGGYTLAQPGPIFQANATAFSAAGNGLVLSNSSQSLSGAFSIECWFQTSTVSQMIGGDDDKSGDSTRLLYVDASGNAGFWIYGISAGNLSVVSSGKNYADGNWHYAAGTSDASGNMILYVDGTQAATGSLGQAPYTWTAYWDFGTGNQISGNPSVTHFYFTGSLCAIAVYPVALTSTQVASHWNAIYAPSYTAFMSSM